MPKKEIQKHHKLKTSFNVLICYTVTSKNLISWSFSIGSSNIWNLILNILMWEYNLITNNNNQKLCIFKSKIKTRCKIFLFFFLIFRLSLSSSHFQRIKLIKLLFTKYKSKFIRWLWWRFIYNWLCQLFYESLSQ